jgi:hypothetical protein
MILNNPLDTQDSRSGLVWLATRAGTRRKI